MLVRSRGPRGLSGREVCVWAARRVLRSADLLTSVPPEWRLPGARLALRRRLWPGRLDALAGTVASG